MTIGKAARRVEGGAKVTGRAKYSTDNSPAGVLHAVLVGAPIASGRLVRVEAAAALALPGVIRVITRADLPPLGAVTPPAAVTHLPLQGDEIRYEGEPVAIVLAETIDAAEAGRAAIRVTCEARDPLRIGGGKPDVRPAAYPIGKDETRGDLDTALAASAIRVAERYVQPPRHHNPMETSGTVALFEGERLTLWDSVQTVWNVIPVMAAALRIPAENVHVIAPHTGGAFGCKSYTWPHQILAAACSRLVSRPVKLHLRRSDQYSNVGYQPWARQDISLGADADGHLTAIGHIAVNSCAMEETFFEPMTIASTSVYPAPALRTRQTLERVNLNQSTPMRAPVEGVGLWALESAINELAHRTGRDPLDLRLANIAETDPHSGKPWSSNKLREAYAEGAHRYGWRSRGSRPKQQGPWRIGHGMATASMGAFRFAGNARVVLRADGSVTIESSVMDIGTGTQTILSQIAADELGVPLDRISVRWGDSTLVRTGPTYGSSTTMHTGSAIALACRDVKTKLARMPGSGDPAAMMREAGIGEIVGQGAFAPAPGVGFDADGSAIDHAIRSFGAIFVEVGVDPELGLVRLRRAVGAYSAGRIINPVTARSQMTGAIIWGWGKAAMEQSIPEPDRCRWLSKNLTGVSIPVNADIPTDIQIHFVDEYDPHASAIGARGIGELGATGVDAAVADAVFDAVGARIRTLPITPRRIIEALA
jgi:xanthine dehydrogenase YagR molybdenum-binding subunit